jgi:hypothetical protein
VAGTRQVRSESSNSLTFEGQLAASGHGLATALPMTLTRNQLVYHYQTLGLQKLQSPEHFVAPAFVLPIAAAAGRLEPAVASFELFQQVVLGCARERRGVGLTGLVVRHTCLLGTCSRVEKCRANICRTRENPVIQ